MPRRKKTGYPVLALLVLVLGACSVRHERVTNLDTNGDQQISLGELSDEMTRAVFERGDKNKDELISFEEWRQMAPNLHPDDFKDRDADGDGSVTMEEGLQFTRRTKLFYPLFEGLDDDNDQMVDARESRDFLEGYLAQKPQTSKP